MPFPTLLVEVLDQILSSLPVKYLMQLERVCKDWLFLISCNNQFSKQHLHVSIQRHHLITPGLMDYPLSSVFITATTAPAMQLQHPLNNQNPYHRLVGSCDGIICIAIDNNFTLLGNPSIRKFNLLLDLENLHPESVSFTVYGFGYDNFNNEYKVVAVYCHKCYDGRRLFFDAEVKVYTLGTNIWKKIDHKFPYQGFPFPFHVSRLFVNGTVNWMTYDTGGQRVIVSLHMGNESYEHVLQSDYGEVVFDTISLSVLRDCLSILTHCEEVVDIWVMKEYGIKESWTTLFSVPTVFATQFDNNRYRNARALYVSEGEYVLLELWSTLIVYNFSDGTFKTPEIQHIQYISASQRYDGCLVPNVYVESLISPCD